MAADGDVRSNSTSSTNRNRSGCCIDTLIVSKGASSAASSVKFPSGKNCNATCVFGHADHGRLYGVQIADYIVGKLLASERHSHVIAICLDRRPEAVREAASAYLISSFLCSNNDSSSSNSNNSSGSGTNTRRSGDNSDINVERCLNKLHLWSPAPTYSNDGDEVRLIPDILTCIRNRVNSLEESLPSGPEDTTRAMSVAVVLFSLSELLLSSGPTALRVVDSIRSCATLGVAVSVVAVIHSTLHPPHLLSRLLPQQQHGQHTGSPFSSAVFVRPNDGTVSVELACEAHVVKVSTVTGKVAEDRDFFVRRAVAVRGDAAGVLAQGPHYSLLEPVVKVMTTQDTNNPAPAAASATDTTSVTFGGQPNNTSNNVSASRATAATATAINRRLITFDSTDPEFDDDSDPDADLDL